MRVLIAEDDPVSLRLLERTLEKWGHEPVIARDGSEAWRVIDSDNPPPMWILDWMMPGKEGTDLCKRARLIKLPVSPYIILLTSLSKQSDVLEGLAAGANDYITKPFEHAELHARINAGIRMLQLQTQLAERITELETALDELRQLRGLIKVCAYCSKVLSGIADMEMLERYVARHPRADYSHGICDNCLHRLRTE
jgi:sigma-B regulation protein RsbU (phosphoserine phosphatase)